MECYGAAVYGATAIASVTGVDGGLAHLTDTQPANECSYGPSVEKLDESHFATLRKQGVVVIDHAVNAEELLAVRNDLSAIGTELSCAGCEGHMRLDSLLWVREEDLAADAADPTNTSTGRQGLLHAVKLLRGLGSAAEKQYLREGLHRPLLVPKQCQWARCAGVRESSPRTVIHRDAVTGSFLLTSPLEWLASAAARQRAITAVLYLNGPEWDSTQHSGALRCHVGAQLGDKTGKTATEVIEIDPVGGRLVLYDARAVLHEETPTDRIRDSLTIWILDAKWPGMEPPPPSEKAPSAPKEEGGEAETTQPGRRQGNGGSPPGGCTVQ